MIEDKIKSLGFELPEVPKPLAAYIPAIKDGNTIYTAGQLPILKGNLEFSGKVGKDVTIEEGMEAAEICLLNCLAAVKSIAGSLDQVDSILKLSVFVNSAQFFSAQPKVANGASELLVKIFGEAGKHVRSAVGVSELPLNAAVEIEMIARIK